MDGVTINLTTGSCLVKYNPLEAKHDDIVSMLAARGYVDRSKIVTHEEYFEGIASKLLNLAAAFI